MMALSMSCAEIGGKYAHRPENEMKMYRLLDSIRDQFYYVDQ
jgi:hypothetical protein